MYCVLSIRSMVIFLVASLCFSSSYGVQSPELVALPLHNERLDASTLFEAMATDLHWTTAAMVTLQQEFRGKQATETHAPVELDQAQIDQLLARFPKVFSREYNEEQDLLVINRSELQNTLREQKLKLRQHLAEVAGIKMTRLDKLPATWPEPSHQPNRVVIVLHGVHSTPAAGEAVALQLHKATTYPTLQFLYPNDAPVMESAERLNQELATFLVEHPDTQISLVAYSLGGLVARSALEWPKWHNEPARQKVDQLILVCPPNHGSALWEYAPLLEGAEIWQRIVNNEAVGQPLRRVLRSITDGLNEASADLQPDSPWLVELNRLPRSDRVRYSILAGDRGPIRPVAALLIQVGLHQLENHVELGPLAKRLADVTDMPELRQGRGDGVVRVQATKLDGVPDWELLPISHLDWGQVETEPGRCLLNAIAKRIAGTAVEN
jgi:pimeloyl-ACP methyl ester carboxylesterase